MRGYGEDIFGLRVEVRRKNGDTDAEIQPIKEKHTNFVDWIPDRSESLNDSDCYYYSQC